MDVNGSYLTIESVKKVSPHTFIKFITFGLLRFIEEHDGDSSILETDDGQDHMAYLINCYEEGERV